VIANKRILARKSMGRIIVPAPLNSVGPTVQFNKVHRCAAF
jgi:hypothetical protein